MCSVFNNRWDMTNKSVFEKAKEYFASRGIPMNRKNYIDYIYVGLVPEEWNWELEAELPEELQAPSDKW
jgi:hypothetical protein